MTPRIIVPHIYYIQDVIWEIGNLTNDLIELFPGGQQVPCKFLILSLFLLKWFMKTIHFLFSGDFSVLTNGTATYLPLVWKNMEMSFDFVDGLKLFDFSCALREPCLVSKRYKLPGMTQWTCKDWRSVVQCQFKLIRYL